VLASLRAAGFAGWLVAETDRTMRASASESAAISRAYLRTLGL
jgi:sugar phosphate isomerase/epimerase